MKTAIVTTTINVPLLLSDYAKNTKEHGHANVAFIVIGDLKTPPATKDFCEKLERKSGYETLFLDVGRQKEYLKRYPELEKFLPYNSIQRRNIGILLAYENGAEKIITIDDDNFLVNGDFIGQHSIVGESMTADTLTSSSGWLNVCAFLKEKNGNAFFPRGYPMKERKNKGDIAHKRIKKTVAVNAGLWLGDPDIDAVTRIVLAPETEAYTRQENFFLDIGTWSPFNSQNTALARDVASAYFLSPHIGRYDDIWASYVVRKISDHLNEFISYGFPLAKQKRNEHNLIGDLEKEINGMRMTDAFCKTLRELPLKETSYKECFAELSRNLPDKLRQDKNFSESDVAMLKNFCEGLKVWNQTIDRVNAK